MDKWNLSRLDGKLTKQNISVSVIIICLLQCGRSTCFHRKQMRNNSISIILSFLVKGNTIGHQYCFGNSIKMFFAQLFIERCQQCLSAFWGPSGLICIFFSRGQWIIALFSLIAGPCVCFSSCNSLVCLLTVFYFYLFVSKKELASLGLDRLKQALQALGLKCGG